MKKMLAVLILGCFTLLACKKGNENFVSTTTLLNAAIGMPAVSLNLNGNAVISNIPFDSIKYNVSNPSGTYTLTFTASGATNILYSVNTGFSSGSGYTAIVYDSANPILAANSAQLYFQKDIIPTSITDAKCAIRFFDLVPDTGSKGHIFVKIDTGTTITGSKYYFNSQSCGSFRSSNLFAEFDTTTRWVKVVKDTTALLSKAMDSMKVGFANGKIYSIYFIGTFGGIGSKKPHLVVQQHN